MNKRIHQAINQAYGGLRPNELLADKIILQAKTPRRTRPAAVLIFALLLITITALALSPRKTAVDNHGSWTYEDGQLMYQQSDEKKPSIVLEDEDIIFMTTDIHTSQLFYITANDTGQRLHAISSDGHAMIPGREIDKKYTIRDFSVSYNCVYLLADTLDGDGQIYRLDSFSDEIIQDELLPSNGWENHGITAFCSFEADKLYTYSADTGLLACLDTYSHTLQHDPVTVQGIRSILFGYEESGGNYLFALSDDNPAQLLIINTVTGEKTKASVSLPEGSERLIRDRYTLYAVGSEGQYLADYNIAALSGKEYLFQLTIINSLMEDSEAEKSAEALFHQKYPHVEIVHRWIDDPRVIATEMMADEGTIDIIAFQPGFVTTSIPLLLRSGALLDLTDSTEIQAAKADYRDIWDLVSIDGHQYGVPAAIQPNLWQLNTALAAVLGWETPDSVWTWTEFEALIDKVIAYNQTSEKHMYLLADSDIVPYMLRQYEVEYINPYAGTADFATERYLKLLEIWKRLYENSLLYPYESNGSAGGIHDDEAVSDTLLRNANLPLLAFDAFTYILPPVWDENTPYVADVNVTCVNANTRYPEEAKYYLACLLSIETAAKTYYENFGQWLKDKSLYSIDAYLNLTAKNENRWNYALEHAKADHHLYDLDRLQWRELLPQLVKGQLTPQEYAQIMQQQADMLLGE